MTQHMSTLVGWCNANGDMLDNEDPNHHTCSYECDKCSAKFTYHYVICEQAGWYTGDWRNDDARYCLKGNASHCCKESYLYPCQKCGTGWIKHSCHKQSMCFDQTGPKQPMYDQCINCGDKTPDPQWPNNM